MLGLWLGLGPAAALGIGRFAYALVLPAMQSGLGLTLAAAGLLGSANTAGYLIGSFFSAALLFAVGYRRGFYAALFLQALCLLALALTSELWLLATLRFAQGFLGSMVFVGGAALMLAAGQSGRGVGAYFGGVGVGIVLSPWLLLGTGSWQQQWAWLGVLAMLLAVWSLRAWPLLREPAKPTRGASAGLWPIAWVLLAYGLYGAGYIGYMTFVTTLLSSKALFWSLLGVGAMLTGVVWGRLVDRVGGARGAVAVLAVLLLASLPPLLQTLPWVSAFLFGVSFLGVITAVTQAFRVMLPPEAWPRAMGISTAAFALGQAVGPFLAGWVGQSVGNAQGALWTASLLLSLALVAGLLFWWQQSRE